MASTRKSVLRDLAFMPALNVHESFGAPAGARDSYAGPARKYSKVGDTSRGWRIPVTLILKTASQKQQFLVISVAWPDCANCDRVAPRVPVRSDLPVPVPAGSGLEKKRFSRHPR